MNTKNPTLNLLGAKVARIPINYTPWADEISLAKGQGAYSSDHTIEIAFFKNDEWVTTVMTEFVGYKMNGLDDDRTVVYQYVPRYLVQAFIDHYRSHDCCSMCTNQKDNFLTETI